MAYKDFDLGSARWGTPPDCSILEETRHPRGGWVSIVESASRSDNGKVFVCVREHRRAKKLTILQPKTWKWTDGREDIDAPFLLDWEYTWGFSTDKAAASAYVTHVLKHEDHPGVPKVKKPEPGERDAQRSKCYAWEKNYYQPSRATINKDQARALADLILQDFQQHVRLRNMKLRLSFNRRGGSFCRGFTEVNIAPYQMNRDVVVHEMSHLICHHINGTKDGGHGPKFIGIFMLMLAHYQGYCLTDMINKAVQMNLKFVFPVGGFRDIFTPVIVDERIAA
jgi:hypothetical protein